MKKVLIILFTVVISFQLSAQNCSQNENVTRFMGRGKAALKSAEKPEDYKLAANEFLKVLEYDAKCPDVYYQLALCYEQMGKLDPSNYKKVMSYLQTYLSLRPDAPDKQEIQEKIYEMEFLIEKTGGISLNELVGKWKFYNGSGVDDEYYNIEIYESNGNLYVRYMTELEIEKLYTIKGGRRYGEIITYNFPNCTKCKPITTLFPKMEYSEGWYIFEQNYGSAKIEYNNGIILFKTESYISWRTLVTDEMSDDMMSFHSTYEKNTYQIKIIDGKLQGSETCTRYKKCSSAGKKEIKCTTDCTGECGNKDVYFVKQR